MNFAYEEIQRALDLLEKHVAISDEVFEHLRNAQAFLTQEKTCSCGPNQGCTDCPC